MSVPELFELYIEFLSLDGSVQKAVDQINLKKLYFNDTLVISQACTYKKLLIERSYFMFITVDLSASLLIAAHITTKHKRSIGKLSYAQA